jgi:hypothetical protein
MVNPEYIEARHIATQIKGTRLFHSAQPISASFLAWEKRQLWMAPRQLDDLSSPFSLFA